MLSDALSAAPSLATRLSNKARLLLQSRVISPNLLATAAFLLGKTSTSRKLHAFRYRGLPFALRRSDWFAVEEVFLREEYRFVHDFLAAQLDSASVVYDLGANIGCFALYAGALERELELVSVEADPDTFQVLEHNRRCNPQLRWTTVNAAIWRDDAGVDLERGHWSTSTSVTNSSGRVPPTRSLRLAALAESLGHSRVALVKMDIEGAEEQALSASEPFLDCVDALAVEVHPKRCSEAAVRALLNRHFRSLSSVPGRNSQKPLLLATR